MGNTFGTLLRLTTFGESHGPAVGGVIDGFPSNMEVDYAAIDRLLALRRPKHYFDTARREPDKVRFLSGIKDCRTIGTPIAFIIENKEHDPSEYDALKDVFRPSHADFTYQAKYGIRDHRGGGRASARETAARVVAGALAMQFLEKQGITIDACVTQIGNVKVPDTQHPDFAIADASPIRCPHKDTEKLIFNALKEAQNSGDTLGGVITCVVSGCKAGLGEPMFDKLGATLAHAMMSIPSARGFEVGEGFASVLMTGCQYADRFNADFSTKTNRSGGIQGGISNGMDIRFSVAFHPVVTTEKKLQCIDSKGNAREIKSCGRHDICHVPRTVPIVQSMAALVIMDALLMQKTQK